MRRSAALPLLPAEPVRCPVFACTLAASSCARRAVARWPSGRRRGARRFLVCGACLLGAARARELVRLGWRPPRDSQPAEVLDNEQRAARERWRRTWPARVELEVLEDDPLAVASAIAGDDRLEGWSGAALV